MKFNKVFVLLLIFAMGFALASNQYTTHTIIASDQTEEVRLNKSYSAAYTAHDPIWIQSNQEFIDQAALESWPGDGSEGDPFIITGYSFNQETQPLRIWDTDVHWQFINNRVDGVGDDIQCGTWIETVSNGAIIDCEFLNRHSGMIIMDVENFTISGNYVHDATLNGIEIMNMMTNCDIINNIVEDVNNHGILVAAMTSGSISGNEVSDCGGRGITVTRGFYHSELKSNMITGVEREGIFVQLATNSEISFNTVTAVEDAGIAIFGFNTCMFKNNTIDSVIGNGVSVDYCELSTITMNDIENCTEIGIESLGGSNTSILQNTVSDCDGCAVSLNEDTDFFEIKNNVFLSNSGSCQLNDDGENNVFIYNYFNDWLSPDADSNNFVDLPYEVDGTADNSDDWPVTTMGYTPPLTISTTTSTNETTTGTGTTPDLSMTLIIAGGGIVAIILIAGILVLKRR